MRRIILVLCSLSLLACQMEHDPVLSHFPPQSVFKDGFANKFYNHFRPYDKDRESMTRISYASYQLLADELILIKHYNAGFELRGWQYYHIQDAGLHLDSAWYINGSDTLDVEIEAGIMKNFADTTSSFYKENYRYQEQEHQYISHQYKRVDTLVDGRSGQSFAFNRSYRNLESDSTLNDWQAREVYLKGLGFYYSWEQSTNGIYETELIEQMPMAEFDKRADHKEKRVAYINPDEAIGGDPGFKLCGPEKEIADYYNGDPDAGFAEGKKVMLARIKKELTDYNFKDFQGLLTFRFVISCEGKAGRFVCDSYTFDYQKQEAPKETVEKVFTVLNGLKTWQPTIIRNEARDSYAYITLKIKNAAIIDVLP